MIPKQLFIKARQILFFLAFSTTAYSQVNMFRGNPEHNQNIKLGGDAVFAETAWKFDAAAPIRSTVVYDNNTIYFGSSKGILYALNKHNGSVKWLYNTGAAIESSPALYNGNVFFSDNKQTLYALNASTGKLKWKFDLGESKPYPWGFDYFYSSPVIISNKLVIGSKDGNVYNVNTADGKLNWKFRADAVIRSSPAISGNMVFFGDVDGTLYAVDLLKGKEIWRFFTLGHGLNNADFGFDRRAIISSPVVAGNKVIVGCRDGLFYAVNKNSGKEIWRVDHNVSWVISSIAVKDSIAVTGTSDGRFVQAVNINTGKQLWKHSTVSIVWSSPIICDDKVYIGSQEGVLYCIDLHSGKRINGFQAKGKIFSSPVISDSLLFFGTDMGYMYALKPGRNIFPAATSVKRYVFWEPDVNLYFHYGNDIKIRDYLAFNKYKILHSKELTDVLAKEDSAAKSVIVFASNYFPQNILDGNDQSLLRKYLNNGGRIVVLGNNPITYKLDSNKQLEGFDFLKADSVLNIVYGQYNDLRSMGGLQPALVTKQGKQWGLEDSWTGFLPLPENQADIVLGEDENGFASAWYKKFSNKKGSGFIQIWIDTDFIDDMSSISRVAEYGMEN